MIEHLKVWLEPQTLMTADKSWATGQDSEIAAGILELFHLLPQQAVQLLESSQVISLDFLLVLTSFVLSLHQATSLLQLTVVWHITICPAWQIRSVQSSCPSEI